MKTALLLIAIFLIALLPFTNIAQVANSTASESTTCKNAVLNSFASSLAANSVNCYVTNFGENSICVTASGNVSSKMVKDFILEYDKNRSSCVEAPTILYQSGLPTGSAIINH